MVRPQPAANSSYAQLPNFRRAILRFFNAFKAKQSEQQLVSIDGEVDDAVTCGQDVGHSRDARRSVASDKRYSNHSVNQKQAFASSSSQAHGQGDFVTHRRPQQVTSKQVKIRSPPGQSQPAYNSNGAWDGDNVLNEGRGDGQQSQGQGQSLTEKAHAGSGYTQQEGVSHDEMSPTLQRASREIESCRSRPAHSSPCNSQVLVNSHSQMYNTVVEHTGEQTFPKRYLDDTVGTVPEERRRICVPDNRVTSASGHRRMYNQSPVSDDRPAVDRSVVVESISGLSFGECADIRFLDTQSRQQTNYRKGHRQSSTLSQGQPQLRPFNNGIERGYRPNCEDRRMSPQLPTGQEKGRNRPVQNERLATTSRTQRRTHTMLYSTSRQLDNSVDIGSYELNMNSRLPLRSRTHDPPFHADHKNRNTRHQYEDRRTEADPTLTQQRRVDRRRNADTRSVSRDFHKRNQGDGDSNRQDRHRHKNDQRCRQSCVVNPQCRHSSARSSSRPRSPPDFSSNPHVPNRSQRREDDGEKMEKNRGRQVAWASDNSSRQKQRLHRHHARRRCQSRQNQRQSSEPKHNQRPQLDQESCNSSDYRHTRVSPRRDMRNATSRIQRGRRWWSDSEGYDNRSLSSSPELWRGQRLPGVEDMRQTNIPPSQSAPDQDHSEPALVSLVDSPPSHSSVSETVREPQPEATTAPRTSPSPPIECRATSLPVSPVEQCRCLPEASNEAKDNAIVKHLESLESLAAVLRAEKDELVSQLEEREACALERTEVIRATTDSLKHTRLRFEQRGLGPCPSGFVTFVRACVCSSGLPLWSLTREATRYKESLHRIRHEQRLSYRKLTEDLHQQDALPRDVLPVTRMPHVADKSDAVRHLLAEKCQLRKRYMSSVLESQRCLAEARLQYECQLYCCCHVFQTRLGPAERLTDAKQRYYYNLLDEYRRAVDVNNDSTAMIERFDLLSTAEALKTDCLCDEMRWKQVEPAAAASSTFSSSSSAAPNSTIRASNSTAASGCSTVSAVDDFTSFLAERQPSLISDMYF